jgi:hypothetical protein
LDNQFEYLKVSTVFSEGKLVPLQGKNILGPKLSSPSRTCHGATVEGENLKVKELLEEEVMKW